MVLSKFQKPMSEMQACMATLGKSESAVTAPHPTHAHGNFPAAPEPVLPEGRITTSRLLMQQLGFMSPFSPLQVVTDRLPLTDKLKRALAVVDKAMGREVHKVGLLYVGEGQEQQNEILANSRGSPMYREFTAALGWHVDILTHKGYVGALERDGAVGATTLYWANSTSEIVFHEVVAMPTSETDAQQIHKKKHVGNDYVHIIWCEHLRDYNPLTITSGFNEAHIVVYPLPTGLFRIAIHRNPQLPPFGPLQHGMVINKELLAPLVRQTAVNADYLASVMLKNEFGVKPYLHRQRQINEIIDRYKADEVSFLENLKHVSSDLVPVSSIISLPPPE
jgi:hypothetical protein